MCIWCCPSDDHSDNGEFCCGLFIPGIGDPDCGIGVRDGPEEDDVVQPRWWLVSACSDVGVWGEEEKPC